MLPITSFLSCTDPIDELFSYHQKHHAKTYVTGLVAGRNKTVNGIATHVLPAKSERALNKLLTEYDWDECRLNRERLGFRLYEKHSKTRVQLAKELVDECIEIGAPADTCLFDIPFPYWSSEFIEHLEGYNKE